MATLIEQILSILNNSKTGGQLPVATNFENLDSFIIYSNNNNRIERAQKSTTAGLFLIAENNLSDLDEVAASQDNLNVYDRGDTYTQTQVNALIAAIPTGLILQGNWDADTNTPDITTTTETGYFWIVSVAGNTNLGGITDWEVNDWAVKTATGWAKVDNTQQNPTWGTITGTLSSQTDLQLELDAKANLSGDTFTGDVKVEADLESESLTVEGDSAGINLIRTNPSTGFDPFIRLGDNSVFAQIRMDRSTGGDLYITVNDALNEAIRILASNQNVGIGTNNPQSKLDVEGNLTVGASYSGSNAAPTNGALFEGDVAIGKTTASSELDVNGTVTADNFAGDWNSLATSDFVRSTESASQSISLGTGNLTITGTANTPFIITRTGSIGVAIRFVDDNGNNEITWQEGSGYNLNDIVTSSSDISLSGGSGDFISQDGSTGYTGTFEDLGGDVVTVKNGIITDIS